MILSFDNIAKSYGDHRVLDGISVSASGGKACGLLGRNGAGKTTAIRILTGVLPADSGRILVDGSPVDYKTLRFGYLPEERGLYPKKNVIDQLVYFARLKGMDKLSAVKSCDAWLSRLGMTEFRDRKLETLSKGNQQKIQLITALSHDPEVIILDEPFSGLDPVNAGLLSDVVTEQIGKGKIVFFSSHQMNYIEEFCEDIAVLRAGKISISGSIREIKRSYPRNRLEISGADVRRVAAQYGDGCVITSDDTAILKLDDPEDKRETMKALAERYDLDTIKVAEPTLADIFVEYADSDSEVKK
ncbi:MAG: ATP-binding cassette domain-containing protein [Clostridia bacterium]|nr:ATP-binding cassette domain-containing protein [Clostridia bacterium]MBP5270489.1 ATP-binding cassette domain-containing protein [Clostridia bacterium]